MIRNPVMFVGEAVATLTTILFIRDLIQGHGQFAFSFQINLWLWLTVLFACFAEAVAEGRGKVQVASLRLAKSDLEATLLSDQNLKGWRKVPASQLERGDLVLVEAGEFIPSDGEVIEGVASVDESAF